MSKANAAKGAGEGAAIGTAVFPGIGTGIGAGVGALIGAFTGNKPKIDPQELAGPTGALNAASALKLSQGTGLFDNGQDSLAAVLDYYKKLTGNDPSAVLDATKPERGRVIDQYDTARRAIANFSPRGGASSEASAESYTQEANQLTDITSKARSDAFDKSATLGTSLEGLGLTAEGLASSDLGTVINAILASKGLSQQQSQANAQLYAGLGEALGQGIAAYYGGKGK